MATNTFKGIRDVIAARIPEKLDRTRLFSD